MHRQNVIDSLLELHQTRYSCVFRLERGSIKRQLVVLDGAVAYAESNLPAEHLAHVMLQKNLMTAKNLVRISDLMRTGLTSDEAISQATGMQDTDIETALKEQALLILGSVLSWDCAPRFLTLKGLPRRRCSLHYPIPNLIMESARCVVLAGAGYALPAPSASTSVHSLPAVGTRALLPLNAAEAFIYGELLQSLPCDEILRLIPIGDQKTEHLVQVLLMVGLARLEKTQDSQADDPLGSQIEDMLHRFEVANYYDILGTASSATDAEIKDAYYELARRYHPDRFAARDFSDDLRAGVEKLFTYITGAYATLSNAGARAEYDKTRLQKESLVETTLQGRAAADSDKDKMAEALFRAGRLAARQKQFEKAVERLRECVWLRPDVARYHYHLAVAQSEIASLRKDAERHLLKAIDLEPMNADHRVQLGKLYLKVNLPNKAEAQFQEALHWDPDNSEAQSLLHPHEY